MPPSARRACSDSGSQSTRRPRHPRPSRRSGAVRAPRTSPVGQRARSCRRPWGVSRRRPRKALRPPSSIAWRSRSSSASSSVSRMPAVVSGVSWMSPGSCTRKCARQAFASAPSDQDRLWAGEVMRSLGSGQPPRPLALEVDRAFGFLLGLLFDQGHVADAETRVGWWRRGRIELGIPRRYPPPEAATRFDSHPRRR